MDGPVVPVPVPVPVSVVSFFSSAFHIRWAALLSPCTGSSNDVPKINRLAVVVVPFVEFKQHVAGRPLVGDNRSRPCVAVVVSDRNWRIDFMDEDEGKCLNVLSFGLWSTPVHQ